MPGVMSIFLSNCDSDYRCDKIFNHGKVILAREMTKVQTGRNHMRLVRLCEELAKIHEESRQYKAIIPIRYSSVVRE